MAESSAEITERINQLLGDDNPGRTRNQSPAVDGNSRTRNRGRFAEATVLPPTSLVDGNTTVPEVPTKFHNRSNALPTATASASNNAAIAHNSVAGANSPALAGTAIGARDSSTIGRSSAGDSNVLTVDAAAFVEQVRETPTAERQRDVAEIPSTTPGVVQDAADGRAAFFDTPADFNMTDRQSRNTPNRVAAATLAAYYQELGFMVVTEELELQMSRQDQMLGGINVVGPLGATQELDRSQRDIGFTR